MRILIISYFFPPFNGIGALRVGKSAKYLTQFGHDVRVITAGEQPMDASLPLELLPEKVIYTKWLNVNWMAQAAAGGREHAAKHGNDPKGPMRSVLMTLRTAYKHTYKRLVSFPDDQIGWMPYACRAAARLIKDWRPDVILGSGWPMTSLIVAHRVAGKFRIPWVAELRDLWMDNHYYLWNGLRMKVEGMVERRVLKSAV
jgi:glycosyltransferase involved in cell wall biosynthesis